MSEELERLRDVVSGNPIMGPTYFRLAVDGMEEEALWPSGFACLYPDEPKFRFIRDDPADSSLSEIRVRRDILKLKVPRSKRSSQLGEKSSGLGAATFEEELEFVTGVARNTGMPLAFVLFGQGLSSRTSRKLLFTPDNLPADFVLEQLQEASQR